MGGPGPLSPRHSLVALGVDRRQRRRDLRRSLLTVLVVVVVPMLSLLSLLPVSMTIVRIRVRVVHGPRNIYPRGPDHTRLDHTAG
jgi:hypothetical protein